MYREKKLQEEKFARNIKFTERVTLIVSVFFKAIKLFVHPVELFRTLVLLIEAWKPNQILSKHNLIYGEEMIDRLISSNKSLIRWGDGETFITFRQDIVFQSYNQQLFEALNKILDDYNDQANYYLAVPLTPLLMTPFKLISSGYYIFWHKTRVLFKRKMFPIPSVLMDAFLFRPLSSTSSNSIERLWVNKRLVVVTSSEDSADRFKVKYKNLFIGSVIISYENAYSNINNIKVSILNLCKDESAGNIRILISAGPTAKVLVFQLAKEGYVCYDIGHYLKWKMTNAVTEGVL